MNKSFVSALAVAGLTAASVASQATAVTYELLTGTTPYTTGGVPPTTTNDATLNNIFTPAASNPQTFATPSVLTYGQDFTTVGSGAANTFATWTAVPISFGFKLDTMNSLTAGADTFNVTGDVNGTVGYSGSDLPFSTAVVTYSTLTDVTTGHTATLTTDPNNGAPALGLTETVDGSLVSIYLDKTQSKAAPGNVQGHTGFVTTTTPEPGSVAMIVGMGVSGGIFLRRKRRA